MSHRPHLPLQQAETPATDGRNSPLLGLEAGLGGNGGDNVGSADAAAPSTTTPITSAQWSIHEPAQPHRELSRPLSPSHVNVFPRIRMRASPSHSNGSTTPRSSPRALWSNGERRGAHGRRIHRSPIQGSARATMVNPQTVWPIRPTYVPSLDRSRAGTYPPTGSPPSPDQWVDYQRSPGGCSPHLIPHPLSNVAAHTPPKPSRSSTVSSVASIPEFPFPAPAPAPTLTRRSAYPTPPPLQGGDPSDYSNHSPVAPIFEDDVLELKRSHASYASSHVIPSSWGSAPSDYVQSPLIPGPTRVEKGKYPIRFGGPGFSPYECDTDHEVQGSRAKRDDTSRSVPVIAGLPTDELPSSTSIGRSDEDVTGPLNMPGLDHRPPTTTATVMTGKGAGLGLQLPAAVAWSSAHRSGGATTPTRDASLPFEADNGDARSSVHRSQSGRSSMSSNSRTPILPSTKYQVQPLPEDFIPRASIQVRTTPAWTDRRAGRSATARVPASRKSSRSNAYEDRDDETRASLTSLSELIKRAMRLTSALDPGQPTSRLAVEIPWEKEVSKEQRSQAVPSSVRRADSITDILAHFPSPRSRDGATSRGSSWYPIRTPRSATPAGAASSRRRDDVQQPRRKRKCCGIPFWSFVVLVGLGLLIVAAAVALPIAFVAIPRQRQPHPVKTLADCRRPLLQCLNGGTTAIEGNNCRCICVSGYSGDQCVKPPSDACVTVNFNSSHANLQVVMLGSAIPRLLRGASEAYHVPLNVAAIISLITSNNLSCNSENALVTFGGRSLPAQDDSTTATTTTTTTGSNPSRKRAVSGFLNPSSGTTGTNGSTTNVSASASATTSSKSTLTTTNSSDNVTPTGTTMPFFADNNALDFARVGVLYILQERSLAAAVTAQERLQTFLTNVQSVSRINLVDGIGLDLQLHMIIFSNGTAIGGGNGTVPSS